MPTTEVPTYTRTPPPLSQEPIPTVPSTPESTPNQITMIVRNLFKSPNRILRSHHKPPKSSLLNLTFLRAKKLWII